MIELWDKALEAAKEARADAGYSTTSLSREDAQHAIAVMERFLSGRDAPRTA